MRREPKLAFEMKSRNGRTPAHTAALHGHLTIIERLLEFATPTRASEILCAKDNCGNTLFMDAVLGDHVHVLRYLIENHSVGSKKKRKKLVRILIKGLGFSVRIRVYGRLLF